MTLSDQKRFELLVVFNIFAAIYIFLHKTFVPGVVFFLHDSAASVTSYNFGFWWVYHLVICILMVKKKENAANFMLIFTSIGMVFLTLFLFLELVFGELLVRINWKAVSDTLSYGTSFLISWFVWVYYWNIKKRKQDV